MAATVTVAKRHLLGGGRLHIVSFSTNENYVTTGFALTANQCGLNNLDAVIASPGQVLSQLGVFATAWNGFTGKIQYFWVDTTVDGAMLAEVPNATAIGLVATTMLCFGN